jgi:hypothetical protein
MAQRRRKAGGGIRARTKAALAAAASGQLGPAQALLDDITELAERRLHEGVELGSRRRSRSRRWTSCAPNTIVRLSSTTTDRRLARIVPSPHDRLP